MRKKSLRQEGEQSQEAGETAQLPAPATEVPSEEQRCWEARYLLISRSHSVSTDHRKPAVPRSLPGWPSQGKQTPTAGRSLISRGPSHLNINSFTFPFCPLTQLSASSTFPTLLCPKKGFQVAMLRLSFVRGERAAWGSPRSASAR